MIRLTILEGTRRGEVSRRSTKRVGWEVKQTKGREGGYNRLKEQGIN